MTAPTVEQLGTIRERVEAGAAWLDLHRPGWWQQIDLAKLNVRHECRCVLGQLFGSYYRAPISLDESCTLGFDASGAIAVLDHDADEPGYAEMDDEFDALTAAWTALILSRRDEWSGAA